MRLFRFGPLSSERPGFVLSDGVFRDATPLVRDYDEAFFASGTVSEVLKELERQADRFPVLPAGSFRFGACVARPSKIVCVGLNYRAHAAETGAALPSEPKIFMKATTALCGSFDSVVIPKGALCLDYEVELALVVGKTARYVSQESAKEHIFGYTILNDYSERDFQKNREGQWVKGKSADTFAPLGPFLVPERQLDPAAQELYLRVNGEPRQGSLTSDMVFDVSAIVSSVSQYMTLLPGDIISTGTPSGVGMGFRPPRYLVPGDELSYGMKGVMESRQKVVPYLEDD